MTMYIDDPNSNLPITASPQPTIAGPPYGWSLHFAPATSVTTGLYSYDYYFTFTPSCSGFGCPQPFTTSKEPETIITACGIILGNCPQVQAIDPNVGSQTIAASPAPSVLPTTIVGLNQLPVVQWVKGTGTKGATYTFSSQNNEAWYVGGNPITGYAIQSDFGSATAPPTFPYPSQTTAPSFYFFAEGGVGPYTDTTVGVYGASLQGATSANYTETTAQNEIDGGYTVNTPTSLSLKAAYGKVQINSDGGGYQSLGLGWINYPAEALETPGITFSFNATTPSSNNGSFAMIQLGNTCVRETSGGSNVYTGTTSYALDGVNNTPFYANKITAASAGAWSSADGPSQFIDYEDAHYTAVYRQDHFEDDFMYEPAALKSGQSAVWIPIGQYTWYWNGTATGAAPNPFTQSGTGGSGVQFTPTLTPPGAPLWSTTLQASAGAQESPTPSNC